MSDKVAENASLCQGVCPVASTNVSSPRRPTVVLLSAKREPFEANGAAQQIGRGGVSAQRGQNMARLVTIPQIEAENLSYRLRGRSIDYL